ncbi:MAG: substrate-binding domain-containing protein [Burkholderiaceae bacterium]|nr:substrate-binding domain-containing protein [Burkholderiaceae bacterium]
MQTTPPTTPSTLKGISSMATRQLLAELVAAYQPTVGCTINIESVGGVDAAKRVQAGEPFDMVILASDAIDKLITAGHIDAQSKVDLVHSGVAVAVRAGAAQPDMSSEEAVRQAVLAAKTISYSTGPSGVALAKLFERWGIAEAIASRIVQAPPGVPVGKLVAQGEVELGFQQLSELIGLDGITVVGPLPPAIQITTTFSAGMCTASKQSGAVSDMLAFMASNQTADAKRRQGMEPA